MCCSFVNSCWYKQNRYTNVIAWILISYVTHSGALNSHVLHYTFNVFIYTSHTHKCGLEFTF